MSQQRSLLRKCISYVLAVLLILLALGAFFYISQDSWFSLAEIKHARVSLLALAFYVSHSASCPEGCNAINWMNGTPKSLLAFWHEGLLPPWEVTFLGAFVLVAVFQESQAVLARHVNSGAQTDKLVNRYLQPLISSSHRLAEYTARLERSEILHGRCAMLGWLPLLVNYIAFQQQFSAAA